MLLVFVVVCFSVFCLFFSVIMLPFNFFFYHSVVILFIILVIFTLLCLYFCFIDLLILFIYIAFIYSCYLNTGCSKTFIE